MFPNPPLTRQWGFFIIKRKLLGSSLRGGTTRQSRIHGLPRFARRDAFDQRNASSFFCLAKNQRGQKSKGSDLLKLLPLVSVRLCEAERRGNPGFMGCHASLAETRLISATHPAFFSPRASVTGYKNQRGQRGLTPLHYAPFRPVGVSHRCTAARGRSAATGSSAFSGVMADSGRNKNTVLAIQARLP